MFTLIILTVSLLLIHLHISNALSGRDIVPPPPPCDSGYYFNGNVCIRCPVNSIPSSSGYSCMTCPSDNPIALGDSCTSCPTGKFISSLKSSEKICRHCPSNAYHSTVNAKSCYLCPRNGSVHPFNNKPFPISSARCVTCDKGYFQDMWYRSTWKCYRCNIGSIPRYYGTCSYCPDGYAYRKDGLTDCQPCPAGTYARKPYPKHSWKAVGCLICPVGTYASQKASKKCLKCPPGTSSTPSRTECIADCKRRPWTCRRVCGAGKQWDDRKGKCESCIGNSVSKSSSVTPCVKCFTGQIADSTKQICKCPPGLSLHFAGEGKGWKCTKCPKPLYSVDNDRCQCANGLLSSQNYYNAGYRKSYIIDYCVCKAGYTAEFDYNFCRKCMAPRYAQSQCIRQSIDLAKLCGSRGYINPLSGFCDECAVGFKPTDDKLSCERCIAGDEGSICGCKRRQVWNDSSSRCETCPGGFKVSKDGISCVRCTTKDIWRQGQRDCDCGTGKVFGVSKDGGLGCIKCPPGRAGGGTKLCTPCVRYHYTPHSAMGNCMKCPKHQMYGSVIGRKACPPPCTGRRHIAGRYRERKCVCKYSKDIERDGRCIPCSGLLTSTKDRKRCACLRGGVGIRDGKYKLCKAGTYRAPSAHNGPCQKCSINWIAPRWGSSTCEECGKGKVSLFAGGTKCTWCPTGKFLTVTGTRGRCAAGFYVFRGRCLACPWRSVSKGGTAAFCVRCALGSEPNKDKSECVKSE